MPGALAGAFGVVLLAGCGDSAGTPAGSGGNDATAGSSSGSSGTGGTGAAVDCPSDTSLGEMVPVEAGTFMMGCNEDVDDECESDEKPQHEVALSAFQIDVTEVTQAQYQACVLDGACVEPSCKWDCEKTDYPASCVTWAGAESYCAWAGKRLPTEAEWEKAARGDDARKFPWGNDEPSCEVANLAGCGEEAAPVGSFPDGASPYGALDMAGNQVEMVADFYASSYYEESPSEDPAGPATGERYSGRGGGFKSDASWLRSSKRDWYDFDDQGASLGFRCAL